MLQSIELPAVPMLPHTPDDAQTHESMSIALRRILQEPDLDGLLEREIGLEEHLLTEARSLSKRAYPEDRTTTRQSAPWIDHSARDEIHRALLVLYQQHVRLPTDS